MVDRLTQKSLKTVDQLEGLSEVCSQRKQKNRKCAVLLTMLTHVDYLIRYYLVANLISRIVGVAINWS